MKIVSVDIVQFYKNLIFSVSISSYDVPFDSSVSIQKLVLVGW